MLSIGTGKRKTSVARVILDPKRKDVVINGKKLDEYFTRASYVKDVLSPLVLTEQIGKIGVRVNVHGGGQTGQAGAIRHGISKALTEMNNSFRAVLKPAGLMTRDSRMVERKKHGKRKARRSRQFSKR